MQTITIERLETPEHAGDWHDRPLRWLVNGPGNESQKFSTAREASVYARIRRHSSNWQEAHNKYIDTDL